MLLCTIFITFLQRLQKMYYTKHKSNCILDHRMATECKLDAPVNGWIFC